MKRPKSWNKLMSAGIIPTDAIDGCLITCAEKRKAQLLRIARLESTYEKKPTEAKKAALERAHRGLAHIMARYDLLVGTSAPKAILRYRKSAKHYIHYAVHTIGDHRFLKLVDAKTASTLAKQSNITITDVTSVNTQPFDAIDVPSWYTVNDICATIATGGVTRIVDNGTFDTGRYAADDRIVASEEDIARIEDETLELGLLYDEAYRMEVKG